MDFGKYNSTIHLHDGIWIKYDYQNALRHARLFDKFSWLIQTGVQHQSTLQDYSENHSDSCSQMTSNWMALHRPEGN